MPQPRARYQQELFEEPAVPAIRLPLDVQQQLTPGAGAVDAGAGQDDPRRGRP